MRILRDPDAWIDDSLQGYAGYWLSWPLHRFMEWQDVEWSEAWGQFPHCCNQGQCWMHITSRPSCRCFCFWCRKAKWFRDCHRWWNDRGEEK